MMHYNACVCVHCFNVNNKIVLFKKIHSAPKVFSVLLKNSFGSTCAPSEKAKRTALIYELKMSIPLQRKVE